MLQLRERPLAAKKHGGFMAGCLIEAQAVPTEKAVEGWRI